LHRETREKAYNAEIFMRHCLLGVPTASYRTPGGEVSRACLDMQQQQLHLPFTRGVNQNGD
ncbi:hypothetical protein BaRGS_00032673, partial [Batillaria attramentaria]